MGFLMSLTLVHDSPANESNTDQSERPSCPECGGTLRVTDTETLCTACCLVVTEHSLDPGPEWRSFTDDPEPRARTGPALTTTRHDRGLSTTIGRHRDATGTPLSARKRRQLNRLRREHSRGRWRSKAERNLALGLGEVRRIVSVCDLAGSIREQAGTLFRTAHSADLAVGRSLDALAAASVHAACRCNGLPRSIEEIIATANCDRSSVRNAYTTLNDELGLPTQPLRVQAYLPQLLGAFALPAAVHETAHELARHAEQTGLANGPNPRGVAGACLLVALDDRAVHLTQTDIATVADASPNTLRKHRDALRTMDAPMP
jgi:transcription initiation factor TFIIB